MTPLEGLGELLAKVGAAGGSAVYTRADEAASWPAGLVAKLKAEKILQPAHPAAAVLCPGCERQCSMPAEVVPIASSAARAFVICDKRSDVNRVEVPMESLEQWQTSAAILASWLSRTLGLLSRDNAQRRPGRWEVGLYRGSHHAAHLVLRAGDQLVLDMAGHAIRLADVLDVKGGRIVVDRRVLNQAVNQPIAGAGDAESAEQRRERLLARVREEKAKGTKAFLRVVASEEGISRSRLKQIVAGRS